MKIINSKTNKKDLLYSSIDLELASNNKEVKEEAAQILIEEIIANARDSVSPVTGKKFKKLSKDYRDRKLDETGDGDPDLTKSGDLLNSLTYRITKKGFDIGYFSDDNAAKADGHNNFSGDSKLPKRNFLPKKGEKFISDIMQTLEDFVSSNNDLLSRSDDFKNVKDRSGLYGLLAEIFPNSSKAEIKDKIRLDKQLFNLLVNWGVSKYL